jgi:hypothetical protein
MKIVDKRREAFTRYIGRGSPFGNPFTHLPLHATKALIQVPRIEDSVMLFEQWARGDTQFDRIIPPILRIRLIAAIATLKEEDVLGCYGCRPVCHGDVIIKLWREAHK